MKTWHVERWIRLIAGAMLLVTMTLTLVSNPNWIWASMFVGFMLFQSAFTKFCPMEMILKALGVAENKPGPAPSSEVTAPRAANF